MNSSAVVLGVLVGAAERRHAHADPTGRADREAARRLGDVAKAQPGQPIQPPMSTATRMTTTSGWFTSGVPQRFGPLPAPAGGLDGVDWAQPGDGGGI